MTTAIIYQLPTLLPGSVGIFPQYKFCVVGDNLATITTAGYFNSGNLESATLTSNDILNVLYSYNPVTQVGTFEQFAVVIAANGVITLTSISAAGEVILPTIANHIATYTNTIGHLSEDAATAINGGNIQAGLSGTSGYLASFPDTASKGSLRITAVANTGNTVTTISNAAMGQASTIIIPDPGGATADVVLAPSALVSGNFTKASGTSGLVVDGGAALHAGTTAPYAGGGTSNAFVATGMASTWIVTASILSSTTAVSITSAVPSADTLTVTFSADPGANTTINWIAFTAAI